MVAVNYSTLRSKLKTYCDRATDDAETIIITRKNEKNLVMMGMDTYNSLMENLFLMKNAANRQHILNGIHELETAATVTKSSAEMGKLLHE